ncbi:FAD-dependent oxidoreductase [Candidatus Woesearchaeota archaeon]|nr:FAD-dependent oxidoreductase [Candidatus Woesearchaeota archaeon]
MYDLIIVGAGSAGLTAAIYAGRKQLKTLLITGHNVGGETNSTNDIQNYPGYAGPGPELMVKFHEQAKKWGAEQLESSVKRITKEAHFIIELEDGTTLESKAVILCYGRIRRKLNIPGEEEFFGRGVSTCTTCDAPFYKNKTAGIVGGGNSAVEGTLELAGIADKVYLIHRRQGFRADEVTVQKARDNPKIEFVLDSVLTEIKGQQFVEGVTVKNVNSEETREIKLDGIFLEIGWVTDTAMVEGLVETNPAGEIIVDKLCRTKTPGLYACGDLTDIPFKQTVISAGMGAIATLEAYRFVSGN